MGQEIARMATHYLFDNKSQALDGYYIEDTVQFMLV